MAGIVSGFTQRFGDHSVPLGSVQDHEHCFSCLRQTCRIQSDNVKSCEHIKCPRGCGLHYHACKEAEHSLLCLEERVACINQSNGCPVFLLRKKMSQHISVCPASVVSCNAEWNRLPLYSGEKGIDAIPRLPKGKTYVDCGQLDVAFALRDQRVLIDINSAPRQTRHQLHSPFSQKYSSSHVDQNSVACQPEFSVFMERVNGEHSRDSDAHFDTDHQTSSHENSLHNHLASKETVSSLSSALDIVPNHMALTHQAHNEQQSSLHLLDWSQVRASVYDEGVFPNKRISSNGTSLLEGEATFPDACSSQDVGQSAVISRVKQEQMSKKDTVLHAGSVRQVVKDGQPLYQLLNISISVESITKYQPKPPNMYTFLCSQIFRRDQFVHHFRNVHCEIQAGLNGWMEQRCPLAYLGCPFSFQRLQPSMPDSSICHSWLLESFGLVTNCVANQPLHQTPSHLLTTNPGRKGWSSRITLNKEGIGQPSTSLEKSKAQSTVGESSHLSTDSPCLPEGRDSEGPGATSCHTETATESQPAEKLSQRDSGLQLLRSVIYTGYNWDSPIKVDYMPALVAGNHTFRSRGGPVLLSDLPTEVLRHIARFLDSFSLLNFSLVSRLLRDICCSLLDELGIVVLIWERQTLGQRVSWHVVGKRWTFSTSFHSIRSWQFSGHSPISQHLLTCPYNQDVVINTKPFMLIPQTEFSVDQQLIDSHDRWRHLPNRYTPAETESAVDQRAVAEEAEAIWWEF